MGVGAVDGGRMVAVGDTRLHVVRRGVGPLPLLALHGGPGLDHTEFGPALDVLGDACTLWLVDQRGQGRSDPVDAATVTVARLADDVGELARALGAARYAVLGHSFGACVALRHAVDAPRGPALTVLSAGLPHERWLAGVDAALAAFTPEELRAQVVGSWAREEDARTPEDVRSIMADQMAFHFADPRDPRIATALAWMADARYAPDVLRAAAQGRTGELDAADRLGTIAHPVAVIAGRHDRTCPVAANEELAAGIPGAELTVLEHAGHFGFLEEPDAYERAVRAALARA
jgi:proline iminopeptidase